MRRAAEGQCPAPRSRAGLHARGGGLQLPGRGWRVRATQRSCTPRPRAVQHPKDPLHEPASARPRAHSRAARGRWLPGRPARARRWRVQRLAERDLVASPRDRRAQLARSTRERQLVRHRQRRGAREDALGLSRSRCVPSLPRRHADELSGLRDSLGCERANPRTTTRCSGGSTGSSALPSLGALWGERDTEASRPRTTRRRMTHRLGSVRGRWRSGSSGWTRRNRCGLSA